MDASTKTLLGAIHKVNTHHNLPKKVAFLLSDIHMYVCVSGVKKCYFFDKFYILYGWSLSVCNTHSFLRKKIRQRKIIFLPWLLVLIVA